MVLASRVALPIPGSAECYWTDLDGVSWGPIEIWLFKIKSIDQDSSNTYFELIIEMKIEVIDCSKFLGVRNGKSVGGSIVVYFMK